MRVNAVAPGIVPTACSPAPGADRHERRCRRARPQHAPRARGVPRRGRGDRRVPAQRRCVVHGRRHRAGRRRRSSHESGPPRAAAPTDSALTTSVRLAHLPQTRSVPSQRRAQPVEATCPECGATNTRRVPRARRRRLVGRAQVPALPRTRSRVSPAPLLGSLRPLGLRIDRGLDRLSARRRRRRHVHRRRLRARRPDRGDEGPERPRPTRPRRWSRARGGSGVEGSAVFNHASTMGLNAVITRRLPKVAFLTTRGAPRHARPRAASGGRWTARPTRRWRRSFGDAARPLVRATCAAGSPSGCSPTAPCYALDEEQARDAARGAEALRRRGRRDLPDQRLRQPGARAAPARAVREVLGDVPVSISSEVSPLAKEYARASTTVVDVLMKLIFTGYAHELDARAARSSGFTGELNFADCAATLMPWGEALEQPFRIVFAGPAAGTISSARLGEAIGEATSSAATSAGRPPTSRSSSTASRSSTTRSSSSTT